MIFHNKVFKYLFFSYGVSLLGSCFSTIAINLWILQTTGSARLMFAFYITAFFVNLLFGNIAGTFVDRNDRRKVMWAGDLLNAAVALLIAICMYTEFTPYPLLIAICSLQIFIGLFHYPAFNASLSSILEKSQIAKAMGSITILDNIARIFGLALGGTIVGFFGTFAAFLIDSGTFLLSAALVFMAGPFPGTGRKEESVAGLSSMPDEKPSFMDDLKAGLAFMWKNPLARSFIIMMPIVASFFTMSLMMIQVAAINLWKATPLQFGIMEACIPFGYIIGSSILLKIDRHIKRRGSWIFTGFLLLGPLYLAISQVRAIYSALPLIFILGFTFSLCTLLLNTAIRIEINPEMQGRAFGLVSTITTTISTLAIGLATYFSDLIGPARVLAVSGASLAMLSILLLIGLKPLRHYRSEEKPAEI